MRADPSLAAELIDAVGTISATSRLAFASAGPPSVGFVALATLRHLARHGPMSITDLARIDRVTTQAISLRTRPLIEEGLVARARDPRDGRRTLLAATGAGRAVIAASEGRLSTAFAHALAGLSPAELDALRAAAPALDRLGTLFREAARDR